MEDPRPVIPPVDPSQAAEPGETRPEPFDRRALHATLADLARAAALPGAAAPAGEALSGAGVADDPAADPARAGGDDTPIPAVAPPARFSPGTDLGQPPAPSRLAPPPVAGDLAELTGLAPAAKLTPPAKLAPPSKLTPPAKLAPPTKLAPPASGPSGSTPPGLPAAARLMPRTDLAGASVFGTPAPTTPAVPHLPRPTPQPGAFGTQPSPHPAGTGAGGSGTAEQGSTHAAAAGTAQRAEAAAATPSPSPVTPSPAVPRPPATSSHPPKAARTDGRAVPASELTLLVAWIPTDDDILPRNTARRRRGRR